MSKKKSKTIIDTSTISEVRARLVRQGAKNLTMAWLGKSLDAPSKTVNEQSLQTKARNKLKEAQRKLEERKKEKELRNKPPEIKKVDNQG
jgi:hypothetical protein